ncbi:MAG: hypothetical protein JXA82_09220 [Sedimentisphaerales bacterium]|nr:hypothetical protein [Sedimentisphaerales bacterium]
MQMKQKTHIVYVLGMIILLAMALVVGICVWRNQSQQEDLISKVEQEEIQTPVMDVVEEAEVQEMSREDREFLALLDEAIEKSDETEQIVEGKAASLHQTRPESGTALPIRSILEGNFPQGTENLPQWQRIWTDLNLSEEEQNRLREGFLVIWERWLTMPDEERQAERQRLLDMRTRWEGMSEQERTQASRRMRDRFQQWRQSGQVELPPLSLD